MGEGFEVMLCCVQVASIIIFDLLGSLPGVELFVPDIVDRNSKRYPPSQSNFCGCLSVLL